MNERFRIEDNTIIDSYTDGKLDNDMLCDKLNDLEETRLRKNRKLKKFRDREDRYQSVISGVIAFLQLYMNNEIWSDLDE